MSVTGPTYSYLRMYEREKEIVYHICARRVDFMNDREKSMLLSSFLRCSKYRRYCALPSLYESARKEFVLDYASSISR